MQRAHSLDGKVQVELAQLRYMLPRLTGKGTAMSRLAGGIGGRGPGKQSLKLTEEESKKEFIILKMNLKSLI